MSGPDLDSGKYLGPIALAMIGAGFILFSQLGFLVVIIYGVGFFMILSFFNGFERETKRQQWLARRWRRRR